MYYDSDLYNCAIRDIDRLCFDFLDDCVRFANSHDYDVEWVLDRFQERFSKAKSVYIRKGKE